MHDTKETIHPRYSRLSAVVLAIFLSSCLTIGDTDGGPGVILNHYIHARMENDLAPLYGNVQSPSYGKAQPNKVRFGYQRMGCQRLFRANCIEFTAGPEIEDRPDVLRKLEELISDPCLLFPAPQILSEQLKSSTRSVEDLRTKVASDYFECYKSVRERSGHVIEIQIVANPVLPPTPTIVKIRTYHLPTINSEKR